MGHQIVQCLWELLNLIMLFQSNSVTHAIPVIKAILQHGRQIVDISVYDHPAVVLLVVRDHLVLEIVSHFVNRPLHFTDLHSNQNEWSVIWFSRQNCRLLTRPINSEFSSGADCSSSFSEVSGSGSYRQTGIYAPPVGGPINSSCHRDAQVPIPGRLFGMPLHN